MKVSDEWVRRYATEPVWDAVKKDLAQDLSETRDLLRRCHSAMAQYFTVEGISDGGRAFSELTGDINYLLGSQADGEADAT